MFWDKLSPKEKLGFSIATGILIIACFDRLIVNPVQNKFQRLGQQITISKKQLGHDLRNVHQEEFVSSEYEKYVTYIQRSGSDEEETAKILGEIESLARRSNVNLVETKPRSPKAIDFYKEFAVEIEAEGELTSFVDFLHQLNSSSQLLRAERVRLNARKKEEKGLKASMTITKVLVL